MSASLFGGALALPWPRHFVDFAGVAQLVEHMLPKHEVVGSSPITRSSFTGAVQPRRLIVSWPDGGVAERGGLQIPLRNHAPVRIRLWPPNMSFGT